MEFNFKEITLNDKKTFDHYFKKYPPLISEYTFSNLYAWKDSRKIEFAEYQHGLIIKASHHKETYFMPPVGFKNLKLIYQTIFQYCKDNKITLIK